MSSESMLNLSNFGLRFPGLTGFGSKHSSRNKPLHKHDSSSATSISTRLKPLSSSPYSSSSRFMCQTAVSHASPDANSPCSVSYLIHGPVSSLSMLTSRSHPQFLQSIKSKAPIISVTDASADSLVIPVDPLTSVSNSQCLTAAPCNIPVIPFAAYKHKANNSLVKFFSLNKKGNLAATDSHSPNKSSKPALRKVHSNDNRCFKVVNRKNKFNNRHQHQIKRDQALERSPTRISAKVPRTKRDLRLDPELTDCDFQLVTNSQEISSIQSTEILCNGNAPKIIESSVSDLVEDNGPEEQVDRKGYLTLAQFRERISERLIRDSVKISDSNEAVVLKSYKSFSLNNLPMTNLEPEAAKKRSAFKCVKSMFRNVLSCFLHLFAP